MTKLIAQDVSVFAADIPLVKSASFNLAPGELVAILGPNGAGKTSLLRAIMGLTPMTSGSVSLNEEDCTSMSPSTRARHLSYLPQIRPLAWPITVRGVISLGRFAHGAALGKLSDIDAAAVENAIESCDLTSLAERNTDSLSGGEIARVHFARAIAASTPLLIADEPVAALDPLHQLLMAELLSRFVSSGGGALVVLHEVALAARIADRLIWMRDGRIVADGPPAETLSSEMMAQVYSVKARIRAGEQGFEVRIEDVV